MNWRKKWSQRLKQIYQVTRVADIPSLQVVWSGPSQLTGAPIMVVAACSGWRSSINAKTGDMVQVYILPLEMKPRTAWYQGGIEAVCPDACPHRSDQDKDCYVNWSRLTTTWKMGKELVQRGDVGVSRGLFQGAIVRFGAGGDPSAVPLEVWAGIASEARGWSGYTANWQALTPEWSRLFMASVSSLPDVWRARSAGWRIYAASESSAMDTELAVAGVKVCPSHSVGLQCVACRQCDGTSKGSKRPDYFIPLHGQVGAARRRKVENA